MLSVTSSELKRFDDFDQKFWRPPVENLSAKLSARLFYP